MKVLTTAARNIYPDIRTISSSPTDPEVLIQRHSTLLICSPDYLGLAGHPKVISAVPAGDATAWRRHNGLRSHFWVHRGAPSRRRERVLENARMLRRGLRELGCDVRGEGQIVPGFIGDDAEVDRISHTLEEPGVFASAVRFPAVARGEAIV